MSGGAVLRLSLDEPLRELRVDAAHSQVQLVLLSQGEVVAELIVPATDGSVGPGQLRESIAAELGEHLWRLHLERAFVHATRGGEPSPSPSPSVSVVVATRDRPEGSGACLDGLQELRTRPHEVIAVDGSPARGAVEPSGDVIAFIDDDCVPDPGWLDGLGASFADPLVMAVAGYVGSLDVGNHTRRFRRTVHDGLLTTRAPGLHDRNAIVRREAFETVGLRGRDADLFGRVLTAGYRVVFDPGRIVWGMRPHPAGREVPRLELSPAAAPNPPPPHVVQADDPPLTVTIASYNRRERLAEVLQGLAAQTYPPDRFELVLVLDGSTDGSAEMARSLDLPYSMRVLEQENRGLAASRNRGGREAKHPIVVWLDDDIVPDPGFLAAHAAAHRHGQDRVVLGHYPPARMSGDLLSTMVRGVWHDFFRRRSDPHHRWSYIDFADGNISSRPSLLQEAGGWDEDLPEANRRQDWEFAIRLLGRGVRFEDCPDASGRHYFDATLATALRNRKVEGHADIALGRKHPSVRGHLFVARIARTAAAGGPKARLIELAYRRPGLAAGLIRARLSLLRPLEALDRRSAWWASLGQCLSLAYLNGVRDALPSLEEFHDFVAPTLSREHVQSVPVRLDRRKTLDNSPVVTRVAVALEYGAAGIAELDAMEPETQWDWERLTERVGLEAWGPFRAAVVRSRGQTDGDIPMALPETGDLE